MKILVACEESQAVTKEFRRLGHEAYSCDILECNGGHPEWHIKGDVIKLLNGNCTFTTMDGIVHTIKSKWGAIISFPPCTHLSNSGARHFSKKREDGRQREAIELFAKILNADCEKIAVENPINIISGEYIKKHFPELCVKYNLPIKSTQRIQPWQFGDEAQKTTCLWLKGLCELKPTKIVEKGKFYVSPSGKKIPEWYNKNQDPSKGNRQKSRSVTFPGIAKAMAEQWGKE